MNEFGGLSHPKTPKKNQKTLYRSWDHHNICMNMYDTKNNIMVCPKMVPRKITIRE